MNLNEILSDCRKILLKLYFEMQAGHIGASLSCLEILVFLYFKQMSNDDQFILSKGHAACALYTVLNKKGYLTDVQLNSFYKQDTLLAAHPPCGGLKPYIPFGTGSLGHGLSLAVGLALSQRFTKKLGKVYCVISEGDLNEGSTWEAVLFASHQKLSSLYVIVDRNRLQGFGSSEDVLALDPLDKKFESFGWSVSKCNDGHNFELLQNSFSEFEENNKPKVIIAETIKGHSVSFMENKMEWHYLPINEFQLNTALGKI